MAVNPGIFKAYDIRGQYPATINEEAATAIGKAIAVHLKPKTVAIGRDMRLSGTSLFDALAKGLIEQGCDVVDLGLVSTDMVYFAAGNFGFDVGVMITASHNPAKDNGFKICKKNAVPVGGDSGLDTIKHLAVENNFSISQKKGHVVSKNIYPDYAAKCLSLVNSKSFKPLKIVVDAGNGMGGKIWSAIQEKIQCKTISLFFELDGSFPNHVPNPLLPENIAFLAAEVKKQKADLGLAFDGDADRVFLTDETGNPVTGGEATCLIAEYFLSNPKNKGAVIVYDVRNSKAVPDIVIANGGKPFLTRVGHSFIKQSMAKQNALFGGEYSGHYYFRDNYNADSGLIAALILLQIISDKNQPLSEILVSIRKKWIHSDEINFEVADKQKKIDELKKKYGKIGKISELDGVTIDFGNWWFNVRPSNTEPLLRLNVEANSKKLLEEKLAEMTLFLNA